MKVAGSRSRAPATAIPPRPLPVRVLVTASDGSHPDGSGHGTYADGRFFAQARFTVGLKPGRTTITLRGGPNYAPLEMMIEAPAGKRLRYRAALRRWFSLKNAAGTAATITSMPSTTPRPS